MEDSCHRSSEAEGRQPRRGGVAQVNCRFGEARRAGWVVSAADGFVPAVSPGGMRAMRLAAMAGVEEVAAEGGAGGEAMLLRAWIR